MRLLIIENTDQDRFGIDTVIMAVSDDYSHAYALETSGLERPKVVDDIPLDEHTFSGLIALGSYRGFMG